MVTEIQGRETYAFPVDSNEFCTDLLHMSLDIPVHLEHEKFPCTCYNLQENLQKLLRPLSLIGSFILWNVLYHK